MSRSVVLLPLLALMCLHCLHPCSGSAIGGRMPRLAMGVRQRERAESMRLQLATVDPSAAYTGLGLATAVGIYQKVVLGRFVLSWFPQLYDTFPFLAPVYTVTEPYLRFFRSKIPGIAGFDVSSIAAFFVLDIAGNAAASLGCEIPADLEERLQRLEVAKRQQACM